MPFHWCADETAMLMTFLSSLPLLKFWWKSLKLKKAKCCEHDHEEDRHGVA